MAGTYTYLVTSSSTVVLNTTTIPGLPVSSILQVKIVSKAGGGGGGGGYGFATGGGNGTGYSGGGGGAGFETITDITLPYGDTIQITLGNGGTGGGGGAVFYNNAVPGNDGGDNIIVTSVTTITTPGGKGGPPVSTIGGDGDPPGLVGDSPVDGFGGKGGGTLGGEGGNGGGGGTIFFPPSYFPGPSTAIMNGGRGTTTNTGAGGGGGGGGTNSYGQNGGAGDKGYVQLIITAKQTPTILTWPTPVNSITVGQPVQNAGLVGGTSIIVGTFSYITPMAMPPAGISTQQIVFTPGDTTLYELVYNSVDVTVTKIIPTVTWPSPTNSITVGQEVQVAGLINGSSSDASGTFVYITPTATPPVGLSTQQIAFIPTDTASYEERNSTVIVTVLKATPIISSWPTTAYVYLCGQLLKGIDLSGGSASVPGIFTFVDVTVVAPNGTTQQDVVFTPTDTANYNTVNGTIAVTTYCRTCDNDRGKPNSYGADHESVRVRKRIDACACCRRREPEPAVVERCTKCDITTSSQPHPTHAHSEHQRMMHKLVRCPLYEKTYTIDIVCEDVADASKPSGTVPPAVALLNSQNPYVRYEYRTYDRISGIEEIADTVRGISSSEVTARRRRIQEVSVKRRHAEHFRVTPPQPPCRGPRVGPQPGVPIAPVTPCNPGTQRVDYSIPNK